MREGGESARGADRVGRRPSAEAFSLARRPADAGKQLAERLVDRLDIALRDEGTSDRRQAERVVVGTWGVADDVVDRHAELLEALHDQPESAPPLLPLEVSAACRPAFAGSTP